jgi:hypothetical protein
MDRGPSRAAAALCSLFLAAGLAGQWQFDPLFGGHLPTRFDRTMRVRLVDVDGDGDLDLVEAADAAGVGAVARLQRNDGSGLFTDVTATQMPPRTMAARWLDCGDLDGDGDVDLVFADIAANDSVAVFLNQGGGQFVDSSATAFVANVAGVWVTLLVDIDGDGDRDLVCGGIGSGQRVFVNDGSGHFADETASRLPLGFAGNGSSSMVAGDLDGDGDQDLVFGDQYFTASGGQPLRALANQGNGVFVDATLQWLPPNRYPTNEATALALGDADGDGDPDLLVAHGNQNQLLRNNGLGAFTDVTALTMPYDFEAETAVVFADGDGDGDSDIVTASGFAARYLRNVGGIFVDTLAQSIPWSGRAECDVVAGDVDGDGDLDLLFANAFAVGAQNRLVLNDGNGVFRDAVRVRVPTVSDYFSGGNGYRDAVDCGDVDGDGDVDVVAAGGQSLVLLRSDGVGGFQRQAIWLQPPYVSDPTAVHLADVDGDGDLDVLSWWYSTNRPARLSLNDGVGHFTDVSATHMTSAFSTGLFAVDVADFDLDGDVDAVGVDTARMLLWENDGTGRYTVTVGFPAQSLLEPTAVHAADFDGDGDPDLVIGQNPAACVLLQNDGAGGFTNVTGAQSIAGGNRTRAFASSDVDGDGDLDLMVGAADYIGAPDPQPRLYRNDGAFTFTDVTATQLPVVLGHTVAMRFADLDGDGDPDLVIGGHPPQPTWQGVVDRILTNDGSGTFTDVTAQRSVANPNPTGDLAIADFDRDGDLDLWYAKLGQHMLLCNLRHQLSAPLLLRPGQPWVLEAHARYAPPGVTDVVWPWLSTTRVSVPVPGFGVLGIDPMVPLSPLTIPQPAGVASLSLPVPNVPALYGAALHAQGVCFSTNGFQHLTTVVSDRILP